MIALAAISIVVGTAVTVVGLVLGDFVVAAAAPFAASGAALAVALFGAAARGRLDDADGAELEAINGTLAVALRETAERMRAVDTPRQVDDEHSATQPMRTRI